MDEPSQDDVDKVKQFMKTKHPLTHFKKSESPEFLHLVYIYHSYYAVIKYFLWRNKIFNIILDAPEVHRWTVQSLQGPRPQVRKPRRQACHHLNVTVSESQFGLFTPTKVWYHFFAHEQNESHSKCGASQIKLFFLHLWFYAKNWPSKTVGNNKEESIICVCW